MIDWLDQLEELEKKATPAPWEFREAPGGDGDVLVAQVPTLSEVVGEPIYDEVLGWGEMGDEQIANNWELVEELRNNAPKLLAIAKAADAVLVAWDNSVRLADAEYVQKCFKVLRAALEKT